MRYGVKGFSSTPLYCRNRIHRYHDITRIQSIQRLATCSRRFHSRGPSSAFCSGDEKTYVAHHHPSVPCPNVRHFSSTWVLYESGYKALANQGVDQSPESISSVVPPPQGAGDGDGDGDGKSDTSLRTTTKTTKILKKQKKTLFSLTHSRYHTPPVASPKDLERLTRELLTSKVGSLVPFPSDFVPNSVRSSLHYHQWADVITQKAEYVLRGHSSLIPGSIVDLELQQEGDPNSNDGNATLLSAMERADLMSQIVSRMEEEGAHFNKEADKFQMGLITNEKERDYEGFYDIDGMDDEGENKEKQKIGDEINNGFFDEGNSESFKKLSEMYSSPGPSVLMYDLTLDAYAIAASEIQQNEKAFNEVMRILSTVKSLYERVLKRHDIDGCHNNTNMKTIPTIVTYNSLLRTASNLPFMDKENYTVANLRNLSVPHQKRRDEALVTAIAIFLDMGHHDYRLLNGAPGKRNSRSFQYMMETVWKYIPTCRTRGNMIKGLFKFACEEGVVDDTMLKTLMMEENIVETDGKHYHQWITQELKDMSAQGSVPPQWIAKTKKLQSGTSSY